MKNHYIGTKNLENVFKRDVNRQETTSLATHAILDSLCYMINSHVFENVLLIMCLIRKNDYAERFAEKIKLLENQIRNASTAHRLFLIHRNAH